MVLCCSSLNELRKLLCHPYCELILKIGSITACLYVNEEDSLGHEKLTMGERKGTVMGCCLRENERGGVPPHRAELEEVGGGRFALQKKVRGRVCGLQRLLMGKQGLGG